MGNYVTVPTQKKKSVCGSCLAPGILDRDELAIYKEVGVPKGRLCIESMKFLNPQERSLMLAAASNNSEQVAKLIKSGAPADTYDENRTSPLHIACRQGSIDVVHELLDHRASLDITDCAGWTSLHIASFSSHAEIVALLLMYNADATIINRNGETPWDLASDPTTQQEFIKYWKQRSEDTESPRVVNTPKALYDITAKKAFPRPTSTPEVNKKKTIKKWDKIGDFRTGMVKNSNSDLEIIAMKILNINPYKGLAILILTNIINQIPKPIAEYLYHSNVHPDTLGCILSDPENFYYEISKSYMEFFGFKRNNLIVALRKLLRCVSLPVDNSRAINIINNFAMCYWHDSSNFKSAKSVESLTLSIIMLDFALHEQTSSQISKGDFITSTAGMHDGEDFSEKYLTWVYEEVRKQSIRGPLVELPSKNIFSNEPYSGHLAYKCNRDWKERFFIISQSLLWSFTSNVAPTPQSFVPLQGLSVHFDTRMQIFTITNIVPFPQIKLTENGLVYVHMPSRLYFKAGNLKLWLEGFQGVSQIKLTIV